MLKDSEKKDIINQNIRMLEGSIYNLIIAKKVNDSIEEKSEKIVEELNKLEKKKDSYIKLLNELPNVD